MKKKNVQWKNENSAVKVFKMCNGKMRERRTHSSYKELHRHILSYCGARDPTEKRRSGHSRCGPHEAVCKRQCARRQCAK